ncbi:tuberin isoform X1, partial [Tachysurus ichikawai]
NTSWLMCLENPPSPFSSELGNMPLQELSSVLMAMDGVREPQTDAPSACSASSDAPKHQNKPSFIQRSNTAGSLCFLSSSSSSDQPGRLHRSISWAGISYL